MSAIYAEETPADRRLVFFLLLQPVSAHTLIRTIATARVVLPSTIIRLAAGRQTLSEAEQAMCFMAGANAVFTGEQMLTTPCASTPSLFVVLHT